MIAARQVCDAFAPEQVDAPVPTAQPRVDLGDTLFFEAKPGVYSYVKFVGEWAMALALFLVTLPLLVALAILVKVTSPGPALYLQQRLGKNGRRYRILKLRSMVKDAEAGTGAVWAAKSDARITPIGNFLRNTHLDELPQLINVLRGEMSLIGPRPERPEIAAKIARAMPEFRLRLAVRPGVTGLAQMLLPADDPHDAQLGCVRKKLAHDLYYIRNISVGMDLRVALSTPCYFLAAAIDALRHGLVRSHGIEAARSREAQLLLGGSENPGC